MKWTQDQSIGYECACELIGHLMAIKSEQIEIELNATAPNQQQIEALRAERSALHREREALYVTDDEQVERIRRDYGAAIRAFEKNIQATA